MIDIDKSAEESIKENERRLGRSLTSHEESAIKDEVNSAAVGEMGAGAAWIFVLGMGAVWILNKTTSIVTGAYSSFVEPYWMWMIQSHTDSFLNLILQVYIWPIVGPLALCLLLVCLPAIITAILIMLGTSWLMTHADGSLVGILSGLGGVIGIIMLVICPLYVLFLSAVPMSAIVFSGYAWCHRFIKDKVFHLTRLAVGWWLLLTHLVIPAILISLVVYFAADKSHIKNGKNIYQDVIGWRAN